MAPPLYDDKQFQKHINEIKFVLDTNKLDYCIKYSKEGKIKEIRMTKEQADKVPLGVRATLLGIQARYN